ncbi:MAG: hypothetical protein AAB916_01025 [Patescibacteria group bacterium]
MRTASPARIIANFFLDGAKIVFGSLVIGAFIPSTAFHEFPWFVFLGGITMTVIFLFVAHMADKKADTSFSEL